MNFDKPKSEPAVFLLPSNSSNLNNKIPLPSCHSPQNQPSNIQPFMIYAMEEFKWLLVKVLQAINESEHSKEKKNLNGSITVGYNNRRTQTYERTMSIKIKYSDPNTRKRMQNSKPQLPHQQTVPSESSLIDPLTDEVQYPVSICNWPIKSPALK